MGEAAVAWQKQVGRAHPTTIGSMANIASSTDSWPKRLAFVITELEPGGAERCLVELATRLDRSRFSPVVYSLAPPPAEEKQALVGRLSEAQIPTHFLGFTSAWDYFRAVRQLEG